MQYEGVNNEIEKLANSITSTQKKEMHNLQNIEPTEIVNVSYDADENFFKRRRLFNTYDWCCNDRK